MRNTKLAAAALSASLLTGATAGAVLSPPMAAMAEVAGAAAASPLGWVGEALKKLVDDGTISQEQSRSVAQALADARPAHGRHGGHGRQGGHAGGVRMSLDAAAKALGMARTELRAELAGGKTIAQVATERDVNVQTVIDAMVADFRAHLGERVAAGGITQERADAKAAVATERFTALVNGDVRQRGQRGHTG